MSSQPTLWSVRFTAASERDLREIDDWTKSTFGISQAKSYAAAIATGVESLEKGPKLVGVKQRGDVADGLFSLRTKIKKRKGRHLLYFRVAAAAREIIIVRVLHDAMDPSHHIPAPD